MLKSSRYGFSLIELLVIIVIIAILSAVAAAGLVDYSRTSKLNAAANELITTLNTAKSNALSQVKTPALCADPNVLNGYKVVITSSTTYDLYVVCLGQADKKVVNTKSLPDSIVFSSPTPASFFFPVLTGGVIGAGTITLSGYGKTKTVVVDSKGIIR